MAEFPRRALEIQTLKPFPVPGYLQALLGFFQSVFPSESLGFHVHCEEPLWKWVEQVGTRAGWVTLGALWLWVQALCQGMLKGQLNGQAGPALWHSLHGLTWVQVLPSEMVHTCSPRTLRSKQRIRSSLSPLST